MRFVLLALLSFLSITFSNESFGQRCKHGNGKCLSGDKVTITPKGVKKISDYSLKSLDLNKSLANAKGSYELPEIEQTVPNAVAQLLRGDKFIGSHGDDHKIKIGMPNFAIKELDVGSPVLTPIHGTNKVKICVPINKIRAQTDLKIDSVKEGGRILGLEKHNAVIQKNKNGDAPRFCMKVNMRNHGDGIRLEALPYKEIKNEILDQSLLYEVRNKDLSKLKGEKLKELYEKVAGKFSLDSYSSEKNARSALGRLLSENEGSLTLPRGSFNVTPFNGKKEVEAVGNHILADNYEKFKELRSTPVIQDPKNNSKEIDRVVSSFISKKNLKKSLDKSEGSFDLQRKAAADDIFKALQAGSLDKEKTSEENLREIVGQKFNASSKREKHVLHFSFFSIEKEKMDEMTKKKKDGSLTRDDVEDYLKGVSKHNVQGLFNIFLKDDDSSYSKTAKYVFYRGLKKQVDALPDPGGRKSLPRRRHTSKMSKKMEEKG